MNSYELGIIVVGALVGWWGVSWIIDKVRAINARPKAFELPGEQGSGSEKDSMERRP